MTDRRESSPFSTRIPLDDPSHPTYQDFFADLERACRSQVAERLSLTNPAWDLAATCGSGAALQAHVDLCRARAALGFSQEHSSASLVVGDDVTELDLSPADRTDASFSVTPTTLQDRASWALLSVAMYRQAIGTAGAQLETSGCASTEDDTDSLSIASSALAEASSKLAAATTQADQLLSARLKERYASSAGDLTARAQATRALNDSVLERLKLYLAVPYGAFSPPNEVVSLTDDEARFPALYEPFDENAESAALLLSALGSPVLDDHGKVLDGSSLLDAWFASLRSQRSTRLRETRCRWR
ncbi:MAG: hypothetical protein QM778_23610 [Myxococcales bacterium]